MALSAERVTVAATATALSDGTPGRVIVSVPTGATASVILGGSDVTATTGFELVAGATLTVYVDSGEVLYGIVATGTEVAHVLSS